MEKLTQKELEQKYGGDIIGEFDKINYKTPQTGGYSWSDTGGDIAETGKNIVDTIKNTGSNIKSEYEKSLSGERNPVLAGFDIAGSIAGGVSDVAGDIGVGALKVASTPELEKKTKEFVVDVANNINDTDTARFLINKWNSLPENTKQNYKTSGNFAKFFGDLIGIKGAGVLKNTGSDFIKNTARKAVDTSGNIVGKISAQQITKPVKQMGEILETSAKRFKTNAGDIVARQKEIAKLPTKTLRNAVRENVDIDDIKSILKLPKKQKPVLKELYKSIKNFDKNRADPQAVVGKPIISKIKRLDRQVKSLGKRLDDTAQGLSGKKLMGTRDILNSVDDSLEKIGVTKLDNGLDFIGSNLEGLGSNEKIINNIYKRILNAKDASDFHRIKRYIDNNVSFGKTSGGFTGESERLIKGWRHIIDEKLDNQFKAYNKINSELARKIDPLNRIKKMLKVDKLDNDLMASKAGVFARRLTGNAPSGADLRQLLRDLDRATMVKGKTTIKTEALQDLYNILEKYFPEITGKTSFKGLVSAGIDSSDSLSGKAINLAKGVGGKTDATQRKALINALDEIFR